jgi:AAA15 family ATPase/GTPase
MIESFEAIRFRAFEHLAISGLRPVNIVVGRSASGKTALLEGIRLALGATPQVALTLNAMRGVSMIQPHLTREQFESLWSPLFFDNDIQHEINMKIGDRNKKTASVSIYFDFENPITSFMPQHPHPFQHHIRIANIQGIPTSVAPIVFRRTLYTGEDSTLYGKVEQNGQINFDQGRELGTATEFFPSTWQLTAAEVANWYSHLSIANQEREIVEAIHDLFAEIEDLSVQSLSQFSALHAKIKHRSHKIPVSLVSSGINKFVSLLVAVRNYSSGVVLIDEIENSIYYKMFRALWEMLYKFAIQSGTQLFLTTHSLECLKNAVPLIMRHKEDFNLIQVFQEQGVSGAMLLPGEEAAVAIESDLEVRG